MAYPNVRSIKQVVNEGSAVQLTVDHRNESGTLEAPATLYYRVDDLTNEREILDWTAVSTPASSNTITITGTLNALQDREEPFEVRQITTLATTSGGFPDQEYFLYKVNRIFTKAGYLYS